MNDWFSHFSAAQPIIAMLMMLSLVSTFGLVLGALQIRGIGLGVAGVLFSGLVFGHFGLAPDLHMLELMRDFGLVLFVYSIGVKAGPGFVSSLRKSGLSLNLLAVAIVLLGAALTVAFSKWGKIDMAAAVGIFSGGTTNTPSLGAAQEALKSLGPLTPERSALPALGYAVAYPFGVAGIILAMLIIRAAFRVNIRQEESALQGEMPPAPERMNIAVTNEYFDGLTISAVLESKRSQVVISRVGSPGDPEPRVAHATTVLKKGDTVLAVGTRIELERFAGVVGEPTTVDLMKTSGAVVFRRIVITRDDVVGRTLEDLALEQRFDVGITRLKRFDVERTIDLTERLHFGDALLVVGTEPQLKNVENVLGNSRRILNQMHLLPMFLGITAGILIGQLPISLPGVPTPVRLGIAGGPLLAAIFLAHIGTIGRLHWKMPEAANSALRDVGITLFLASVGLKAGGRFVETLAGGDGLYWLACGAAITLLPLLAAGFAGRLLLKMNFVRVCGLLAGSMTDPPALAFAISTCGSDAPAVSYATVYPATMILRILVAQLLVLVFA